MRTAADGAERTQARPAAPLFVEFADGRFELVADGRSRLSIELADVTAVGEFTNAAGPWADDYFMVLRYRTAGGEEELEVPFNENSGARDAYAGLLAALGAPRTFCLVNCTHPASVFLWPPDRAGTPVWPDYGPARSLGTDRDYARWRKERRRSRAALPQPPWRGVDPATPCQAAPSAVRPTIFLRRGFNGLYDPPKAMAAEPGLRRTALVFSPPVIGVDDGSDDWELCADVYWRIVADVGTLLPDSTLSIVAIDGIERFSAPEEWLAAERRRFEADPGDIHEPPARCFWRDSAGRTRVDARTEFWSQCGGPSPYSDSYTVSFYSDEPELDEAIRGAILRRCAEAGLRVANERTETPGSVRIAPPPAERWTKRIMWIFFACLVVAAVVRFDDRRDQAAMVGIFLFVWVAYLLIERINRWREERRFRNEDIYGEKLDGNDADRTRPSHDPPRSDRSHPTTTRR